MFFERTPSMNNVEDWFEGDTPLLAGVCPSSSISSCFSLWSKHQKHAPFSEPSSHGEIDQGVAVNINIDILAWSTNAFVWLIECTRERKTRFAGKIAICRCRRVSNMVDTLFVNFSCFRALSRVRLTSWKRARERERGRKRIIAKLLVYRAFASLSLVSPVRLFLFVLHYQTRKEWIRHYTNSIHQQVSHPCLTLHLNTTLINH